MKKWTGPLSIGIAILLCGMLFYFVIPAAIGVYKLLWNYTARIDEKDFRKNTTPLPGETVIDICKKFELTNGDKRCLPNSGVYGPDFFTDIVAYFRGLPDEEATRQIVNDKLGTYLVNCENPDNEGVYGCWYDLRGDGAYPILILFTQEGNIYRVWATTGGS